jgi:hypothetical protein
MIFIKRKQPKMDAIVIARNAKIITGDCIMSQIKYTIKPKLDSGAKKTQALTTICLKMNTTSCLANSMDYVGFAKQKKQPM